ncbi:hypothetical protein EVAR_42430_1 [Eumeta japonica]|uniref:Uncharacterized protein n=1 Tax=Eumeta variegata TaxID=151549 RepID=A0A4C1XB39_EUMVA|nr:hypothetical protein EVAR_42430_1 [Eumeta japonica]
MLSVADDVSTKETHKNELAHPVKYHILTESSIRYPIPTQETVKELMTLLELRVFLSGDVHLLSGGS